MLLSLAASPAAAQTAYPARPIHLLVPYAPGGPADIAARLVGAKLGEAWGQQVVVENRPGGRGYIAMTAAAKAPPDGYTLVMATIGEVAITPALFKDVPYSVDNDFAPISLISDATIVLAVHGDSAFKSVSRRDRRRKGSARLDLRRLTRARHRQSGRHRMGRTQHRNEAPARAI